MKQLVILLFIGLMVHSSIYSQDEKPRIYNPEANTKSDIQAAINKAAVENKHVLIQIGGNWCPWCIKLHRFFNTDSKADSLIKSNYVFILVNYSKENKNLDVMKELEFPQRFGFPVLVVLDSGGRRLHTQDSGLLELDKGYDPKKIYGFLENWGPAALNPSNYPK